MIVAEEIQIHLCQNIHAGILGIAIAQDQNDRIYDQQANNHRNSVFMVAEQGEE